MQVRAQDANGDYVFGAGSRNFLANSGACVAQLVQTNLLLKQGEWFLDQTIGTPWAQKILGYGTAALRDLAIQDVVLNTPGVTSISSYSSTVDPKTRKFTVNLTITTQFDPTVQFSVTM